MSDQANYQELVKQSGYDINKVVAHKDVKPEDLVHVMWIKIVKEGKRSRDIHVFRHYTVKEWTAHEKCFAKSKVATATIYDEFYIIHDPRKPAPKKAEPVQAKVKQEPVKKAKPAAKPATEPK